MATYNVNITVVNEAEFGGVNFVPSELPYLQPGDVVNFNATGGANPTIYDFSSTFWTNSSNIYGSGSKTVKSGVSAGTYDFIVANASGYTRQMKCTVDQQDSTPDPFGLTNKTNIDPKALVKVGRVDITGINTEVTASVSGSGSRALYFTKGYKPRQYTSTTVEDGDYITIYAEAEYDYNEMVRNITLTVGGRSQTVQIVTRKWPLPEQVINMGISAPEDIALRAHVATFFGGESQPRLTDYLRGGGLVPSIQQNAHVPTSPPIRLTDLYDTSSALYFIYKPPDKAASKNTSQSGQTIELVWDVVTDYNVGYGKLAEYLEYRYTFTSDGSELSNGNGSPSDVTINSTTGNPGTWSQNNGEVWLRASAPFYSERFYKGTLTIYCRNAIDTSLVISRTVTWVMFFFGP